MFVTLATSGLPASSRNASTTVPIPMVFVIQILESVNAEWFSILTTIGYHGARGVEKTVATFLYLLMHPG